MYFGRLLLALVGFVIFIVLVVVLLFGHGKKPAVNNNPIKPLPSYSATDATVTMTIDGPINGDDAHRQIKVTVSADSRQLNVIQGYSGTVIQNNPFYNTQDAYSAFLSAINNSGFLVLRKGTTTSLSDAGQCALGNRYVFTLQQDGNTLSSLWTTSCSTNSGNFGGDSATLQQLFEAQITNYDTLTQNVNLGY